jgi:hypothetical protein
MPDAFSEEIHCRATNSIAHTVGAFEDALAQLENVAHIVAGAAEAGSHRQQMKGQVNRQKNALLIQMSGEKVAQCG